MSAPFLAIIDRPTDPTNPGKERGSSDWLKVLVKTFEAHSRALSCSPGKHVDESQTDIVCENVETHEEYRLTIKVPFKVVAALSENLTGTEQSADFTEGGQEQYAKNEI